MSVKLRRVDVRQDDMAQGRAEGRTVMNMCTFLCPCSCVTSTAYIRTVVETVTLARNGTLRLRGRGYLFTGYRFIVPV